MLKDDIFADIDRVFLQEDDFAETVRLEGKSITAVVDQSDFSELKRGRIVGQVEADMIIYAKESDFPPKMSPGRPLEVNGREMLLVKYGQQMGMGEAAVRQNRR